MQEILDWWFSQLAGLLPSRWLSAAAKPTDAVILEIDGLVVRVIIRVDGARTRAQDLRTDETGIGELASFLASDPKLPRAILLRLSASQVLHKHVTLPAVARRDLETVLSFEIDRETPFNRDEVYWAYNATFADAAQSRLNVDLRLVPRAFVAPYITGLERAGVTLQGIEVDGGPAESLLIGLKAETRSRRFRLERPLRPLAGAAAALALLAVMTPFLVEQWVLISADTIMNSLAGPAREAANLRQMVDSATRGVDFLKEHRQNTQSVVALLAAVTQALPDDTYLMSFSVHGGKITMSGLSSSAADLIGVLAQTQGFASPAFDAPVVQNEDNNLESFTISAALAPVGAT